ncbi:glycosyltransferase family 4 protein [Eudoraea chungangensis]|uniref:glycosyltransferase family 4 protein n=1 Tax=Eudoraea chungangensis TaxID=1481905 RepID=UPI0023EC63E3|nr:glycosyltransferase family 4 protein [Eudoraea chungangensis]
MTKKRILLVGSAARSLIHFRGDFIKSLHASNYAVYAAAPNMEIEVQEGLKNLGAIPLTFSLSRTGLNPFKDIKSIMSLKQIVDKYNIDIIFPYTIKPTIYSSVAGRWAKIPVVSLITGLGFTFSGNSKKALMLQKLTKKMYRFALRKNKVVIFQNRDDLRLFVENKLLSNTQKTAIVSGSGVNLGKYPYRENANDSEVIRFIMVARLIEEKGISLYLQAAENLKKLFPKAEFHVIGSPDRSPSAIKLEEIQELADKNIIVYHGNQKNVPKYLSNSDIFVLPSFYREGIPRSILEALSIGMPIITTDSPGCRETIKENTNGILITPKSQKSLQNAMQFFLENPAKIKEYGMESRKYAEERFNVDIINADLLHIINRSLEKELTNLDLIL